MSLIAPTVIETVLNAVKNWRTYLVIFALAMLLIFVVSVFRSCERKPKLDEQQIQQSQQAIVERNDAKLREILTNSDMREAEIESDLINAKAAAVNAAAVSHQRYANMSTDELAAEIERRKNQ